MRDDTAPSRHASVGKVPMKEPDFPNLKRMEEQDLEMHAEQAIEMGMTPEEAIRHAREDHEGWTPGEYEKKTHRGRK